MLFLQLPAQSSQPVLKPPSSPIYFDSSAHTPPVFTFTAGALPLALPLTFLPPTAPSPSIFTFSLAPSADPRRHNPLKRRRRLTDVDGDLTSALLRKKRRLRLTLVTSRLSQPFSSPASNIVHRRTDNKGAVWAKARRSQRQRQPGAGDAVAPTEPPPPLRKAAVLNRLRLRGERFFVQTHCGVRTVPDAPLRCQLKSQEPEAIAPTVMDDAFDEEEMPRIESPNVIMAIAKDSPYKPASPSPLGISNYDALDLEDDFADDDEEYDSDGAGIGQGRFSIYSDFSSFDDSDCFSDGEEGEAFATLNMWL